MKIAMEIIPRFLKNFLLCCLIIISYNDNFYTELGKAYREEWNYFEGWNTFNTNQKDKNWFVKTACDITKTNLLPFFDAWSVGISPEIRRKSKIKVIPFRFKKRDY